MALCKLSPACSTLFVNCRVPPPRPHQTPLGSGGCVSVLRLKNVPLYTGLKPSSDINLRRRYVPVSSAWALNTFVPSVLVFAVSVEQLRIIELELLVSAQRCRGCRGRQEVRSASGLLQGRHHCATITWSSALPS